MVHRPPTAVVVVVVVVVVVTNHSSSILLGVHANTKNFCGSDWTAASADCESRQPCTQGTDEECTNALGETCWADTLCDTALGHGVLSNRNDPSHQRFCGTTWEDASTNCAVERHCPSGDKSECDDGQECYSFLGSCNYIDMMVGNLDSASTLDESNGNSTTSTTLPSLELDRDDPTRTNYCGVDWSDAISNCDDDSHWCPDGTDEECPDGKICFAGTDCKYESDLVPTGAPIIPPSAAPTPEPLPTQSPVMYNAPENSRFCGTGWENVRTTCRIGSHCPSGNHADCPTGQQCLGWIQGCNIIDFEKHLRETGEEIFGSDHWLLPMDVDIPGLVDVNSTEADSLAGLLSPTDGLPPPDNILAALGVKVEAAAAAATLIPTGSLNDDAGVGAISADIPRYKDGNNHIFCGVSWLDASSRCSPETFCLHGAAMHVCPNVTEYCFVGVTACDANEWIFPTASPTSASPTTSSPTLIISTESNIIDSASPSQSVTSELSSTDDAAEISFLIEGEDDGDVDDNDGGVNDEENINDDDHVEENTYNDVITSTPTASPSAISTETISIEQIVDEDTVNEMEVATSTIVQSYCALSYVDVVTNCQELSTCNKNEQCLDGYTCFTNVQCTVEVFEVPFQDLSPSPTSTPIVDMPFSQSEVFVYSSASPTSSMTTTKPTPSPVSMTPTTTTSQESNAVIAPHFYCATSLDEISCSASPTCDDETMCPSGMFCFEVPTCYDNVSSSDDFWANTYSITTSPSTSSPSSFPTMLRSITISESPTYYLRSSSLRPTSSATNTAIVSSGRIQNYCAPSEDELLSLAPGTSNTPLCAVTNTCNDELQMCPPGTYCFVDYSCPSEITAEGGAVMTVVIPDSSTERSEVSIASNIEETPTNVTQQPWEIDWESETLGEATIDDTRVGDELEAYWLLKENNSARSVASFSITVMLGLLLLLDILATN